MNKKELDKYLTKLKSWLMYAGKFAWYLTKLTYWAISKFVRKNPRQAAVIGVVIVLLIAAKTWNRQIVQFLTAPRPLPLTAAPKDSGFQFAATDKRTKFSALIGETSGNAPKVQATFRGGNSVDFVLTDLSPSISKPSKSGNKVTFKNVRTNVDLSYQTLTNGIKEDIIVKKPTQGNAFTFTLNNFGATPKRIAPETYGPVFYDTNGGYVFHFAKPFAVDAKGARTDNVVLSIHKADADPGYKLTLIVNQKWLSDPKRAYPISIDPTVVYSTGTQFSAGQFNRVADVTDAIKFVSQNVAAGNAYSYMKVIGGQGTQVATGDTIEYDVNVTSNVAQIGGIDLKFTDATNARDIAGWVDQNGIECTGNNGADLTAYVNTWIHRKCTISSGMNTKTINYLDIVNENDTNATNTIYYANFTVKNSGGTVKATLYQNGPVIATTDIVSNAGNVNGVTVEKVQDTATPNLTTNYQELPDDQYTVGLWHMNESSGNMLDASGNSNTATPNGTQIVSGLLNNARYFNGTSDYLYIADNASIGGWGNTLSYGLWFKTTSTVKGKMITKENQNVTNAELYMDVNNTLGKVRVIVTNTAINVAQVTSNKTVNDGLWHHAVATYDGNMLRLYIDGVFDNSVAQTGNVYDTNANLEFGACQANTSGQNDYYSGLIDEAFVTKKVLSDEEIRMIAQRRPYSVYTSDVMDLNSVTTGWNNINWTELGVTTGDGETPKDTTNLVAQWNFNATGSTATATNDAGAGTCGGTATNCDFTLNNFADTTGQDKVANSGWTSANLRWGAGAVMLSTAATADTLSRADPAGNVLDPNSSDFSVETWIKTSDTAGGEVISNNNANGASCTNNGWRWGISAGTGVPVFRFDDNGATAGCDAVITSSKSITDGQWHLVTNTVSRGGIAVMYIDGVPVGSDTVDYYTAITVTGSLYVGGSTGVLNAVIDSTRFYSRALTPAEIISNYNAGNVELQTRVGTSTDPNDGTWEAWKPTTSETQVDSMNGPYQYNTTDSGLVSYFPMDQTANGTCTGAKDVCDAKGSNHGTATGTSIGGGEFGNARLFNGASTIGTTITGLDTSTSNANTTVEFWMKWDGTQNAYTFSFNSYGLYISNNGFGFNTANSDVYGVSTSKIPTNTWLHVVGVFNNGTVTGNNLLYINGVQQTLSQIVGSPVTRNVTTAANIGSQQGGGGTYFKGTIDEVRVYTGALSASTIYQHYVEGSTNANLLRPATDTVTKFEGSASLKIQTGAPAVDANTVALYHMDETGGSGAYIKDSTTSFIPPTVNTGTGSDGNCTVNSGTNYLDSAAGSTVCSGSAIGTPYMANYSVTANTAAGQNQIAVSISPTALAPNDEVLIINLQGNGNVGTYETKTISSIFINTLTLNGNLTNAYDGQTQKIMVQRVPNFANVTVPSGATLATNPWDGTKRGVLFFRASGTVTVSSGGVISAASAGYRGGASANAAGAGESFCGYNGGAGGFSPTSGQNGTCGGGGGGGGAAGGGTETAGNGSATGGAGGGGGLANNAALGSDPGAGGGGGYGTAGNGGGAPVNVGVNGGTGTSGNGGIGTHGGNNYSYGGGGGGGGTYGQADLSTLLFGSAGAAGGYCSGATDGPSGAGGKAGGIIWIQANALTVSGGITANGANGASGTAGNFCTGSGGGGGAGGSIKIAANSASLGTNLVTASNGTGGGGTRTGGTGGVGRIAVTASTSLSGATTPNGTFTSPNHGTPANTTVINGIAGKAQSFNGTTSTITIPAASIPTGNQITVSFWAFGGSGVPGSYTGTVIWGLDSGGNRVFNMHVPYTDGTIYWDAGNSGTSSYDRISKAGNASDYKGRWTYWTFTKNAATNGVMNIYIDGKLWHSGTGNTRTLSPVVSSGAIIGSTYQGYLDEFKIDNIERSAGEIAEAYRAGRDHYINRTLSSANLSSIQKLAFNIAADRPGTYLSATIGNNAFANYQPDANTVGLWHLDDTTSFNGETPFTSTSLAGWWHLNEASGNAADSTGNGNTLTNVNATYIPGVFNNVTSLNGTTAYQGCTDAVCGGTAATDLDFTAAQSFTLSAWFKTSTTGVTQLIMSKKDGSAVTNAGYVMGIDSTNKLFCRISDGANTAINTTGSTYTDGNWHNFICFYDRSAQGLTMAVDGAAVGGSANIAPVTGSQDNAIDFRIGASGGTAAFYFNGQIDEVRVYRRLLTNAEISANYKEQLTAKDASGNSNNGTFTPGLGASVQGKIGKGRSFNGTSDYIDIPNSTVFDTNNLTIDAWVYSSAFAQNGFIFEKGTVNSQYSCFFETATGIDFRTENATPTIDDLTVTLAAAGVANNQWNHVACVYDGTSKMIYVNGKKVASKAYSQTLRTAQSGERIGAYGGTAPLYFFNGILDEVRVSNTARSPADIRAAYEFGARTHNVTIDFGAKLDSGNLITNSSDLSFTVDATYYGLNQKGSNLYLGDRIIIRENYDGTTYMAQATVSGVLAATGAVTVPVWENGSTIPSGGFTANADVFKWQREYFDLGGSLPSQRNGVTQLSLRQTNGQEGRTIWLDDLESVGNYLTTPAASTITSSTGDQYFQYRIIQSSADPGVSPSVSSATLDFTTNAPNPPTIGSASNATAVSVQWNFTGNGGGQGAITGFKVYDTGNALKATCVGAGITSCTETGLTPNTSYTRKVVAYNATGNSLFSSTATALTLAAVPGIPTTDSATASTINLTPVAGTNPASTQLAIFQQSGTTCTGTVTNGATDYYLATNGTSNGSTAIWQTAATWGTLNITGLTLDTTQYIFCAKARNSASTETGFAGNATGGGFTPISGNFTMTNSMTMKNKYLDGNNATGKFVALGVTTNSIAYSSDGIVWTGLGTGTFSLTPGFGYRVVRNKTRWVATGNGNGNGLAYSADGITWTGLGTGTFSSGNSIAWNGTKWVATGNGSNTLAFSSDGITWTGLGLSVFSGGSANGLGIAWNGTRWVAGGSGAANSLAYSSDGITWTGLGKGTFSQYGIAIAWNGTRWVAVGGATNTIAYSSDGITWTGLGNTIFATYASAIAWNGTQFVATGQGTNTLAYSSDGITWTGLGTGTFTNNANGVAWNGTRWVAAGYGGNSLAYSSNGITWTGLGTGTFGVKGLGVGWSGPRYIGGLDLGPVGMWTMDEASGNTLDTSGYNLTGTPTGTTVITGKFSNARRFNGSSSDYITVSENNALDPPAITIDAWVRPNVLQTGNIVNKGDDSGYRLVINTDGTLTFKDRGQTNTVTSRTQTPLVSGTWYHIAATGDSCALKIYINGVLNATNNPADNTATQACEGTPLPYGAPNTSSNLLIGKLSTNLEFYSGDIDDVHIYPVALDASQIKLDMATGGNHQNVSRFTLNSGTMTLLPDETITAGIFVFPNGSAASIAMPIDHSAELKANTPVWFVDVDGDGLAGNTKLQYGAKPTGGKRRGRFTGGLSDTNFDCDDTIVSIGTGQVFGTVCTPTTGGSGNDGAVTISANKNINTDVIAAGRTYADGVNYSVSAIGSNTITTSATPNGIVAGDEVMLINLQGDNTNFGNVGNYESFYVLNVNGSVITVWGTITKIYGATSSNGTLTGQKIMVQRVPNYSDVTVSGGNLTAAAWDATKNGLLALRASGTLSISSGRLITVNGLGFGGGARGCECGGKGLGGGGTSVCGSGGAGGSCTQNPGFSGAAGAAGPTTGGTGYCGGGGGGSGPGSSSKGGSGGGSTGSGSGAGGGGYGTFGYGGAGGNNGGTNTSGNGGGETGGGGGTYGNTTLTKLYLGSGGGGGGNYGVGSCGGNGGTGGGIVYIGANALSISGGIQNNGSVGGSGYNGSFQGGGGGGGSGGSLYLYLVNSSALGSNIITATNGTGGSVNGGAGGVGRIAVHGASSGTTNPTYTSF